MPRQTDYLVPFAKFEIQSSVFYFFSFGLMSGGWGKVVVVVILGGGNSLEFCTKKKERDSENSHGISR